MRPTEIQVMWEVGGTVLLLAVLAVIFWRAGAAEWRAGRLLRHLLTEAERKQLAADGYLELKSASAPERAYRIPRAPGRVRMYEGGRLVAELCLQPTRSLPASDLILLHKLLIEDDEAAYLATANHFPPGAFDAFGRTHAA